MDSSKYNQILEANVTQSVSEAEKKLASTADQWAEHKSVLIRGEDDDLKDYKLCLYAVSIRAVKSNKPTLLVYAFV